MLPNDNSNPNANQPNTLYEKVQLKGIHDIYFGEFSQLNTTSYQESLKNVTGLMYTLSDLPINHEHYNISVKQQHNDTEVWYGYPLPNKDYSYRYDLTKEGNNYLPQTVLDTVFKGDNADFNGIWGKEKETSDNETFIKNITSTTLRGFLDFHENFEDEFIHMPIPNYYKLQLNESSPIPEPGFFFVNDSFARSTNHSTYIALGGNKKLKIDVLDHVYYPKDNATENLSFYTATVSLASSHLIPTISDLLICYDSQRGRLFGITNSAKFHGLFAIPSLMASDEHTYKIYKRNVLSLAEEQYLKENITMDNVIIMNERAIDPEFIFYGQSKPLKDENTDLDGAGFKSLYNEPRTLEIESLLLYSPDSGKLYSSLKPSFIGTLGSFVPMKIKYDSMLYLTLPFIIFMVVFFWQIQKLNSPSELNKLSNWTFKTLSYSDSLTGVVFLIMGISFSGHTNGQFSWFVVNATFFLIMGMFFELRVSALVLQSQFLERGFSLQTLFQSFNRSTSEDDEPTVPVATAGGEDTALLLPRLQIQLFFQLFISSLLIVVLYSITAFVRHLAINIIIFTQTSLFWPQIFRLLLIDYTAGSSSLSPLFVLTVAITRMVPIVYFFSKEDNLFQHATDSFILLILVINITLQTCILIFQLIYGGRSIFPTYLIERLEDAMGVRANDGKSSYNYHRGVTLEDLEHMGKKNDFVCPICMDEDNMIHLKIIESNTEEATDAVYNDDNPAITKTYMITPCNHIYHPECLTYWMNNKLVCPVCRSNLPPL